MNWYSRYRKHLRSREWRYLKAYICMLRGSKCEHCGKTCRLSLHHKTYARLGDEQPSDVELLCFRCHKCADLKRTWMNASGAQSLP